MSKKQVSEGVGGTVEDEGRALLEQFVAVCPKEWEVIVTKAGWIGYAVGEMQCDSRFANIYNDTEAHTPLLLVMCLDHLESMGAAGTFFVRERTRNDSVWYACYVRTISGLDIDPVVSPQYGKTRIEAVVRAFIAALSPTQPAPVTGEEETLEGNEQVRITEI